MMTSRLLDTQLEEAIKKSIFADEQVTFAVTRA
jgi:hypothetical protein